MKSAIKLLITWCKVFVQQSKLKIKFNNRGGRLGQKAYLLNPQYIEVGYNCRIKEGYRIECYDNFAGVRLFPKLILEDGVIIGLNFTCLVADKVSIGKDTILASNVSIISENHGTNPESETPYHAQPLHTAPVLIGQGCWIGQNVSILPGVTIGDKCVIGSNSVVTKDIASYSLAVGCPARTIKTYDFTLHKWIKSHEKYHRTE